MRFSNGFFGENEATLGTLRFSAMRREVFEENADGTPSEVVKERTYDLKKRQAGPYDSGQCSGERSGA